MENNLWIEYYKDRSVEMPTSGFVEYIDTFDDRQRTMMDMSQNTLERNLSWNRAAPICVSKFRVISEQEFLEMKLKALQIQAEKFENEILSKQQEITSIVARIQELETQN